MDITSGETICLTAQPVVFTCVAVEASFLIWQRNGEEIEPNFNIGDTPRTVGSGPYTLSLDEIHAVGLRQANMTSRLVINLTDLMNGDQVVCMELVAHNSVTLHYEIRGDCNNYYNIHTPSSVNKVIYACQAGSPAFNKI